MDSHPTRCDGASADRGRQLQTRAGVLPAFVEQCPEHMPPSRPGGFGELGSLGLEPVSLNMNLERVNGENLIAKV